MNSKRRISRILMATVLCLAGWLCTVPAFPFTVQTRPAEPGLAGTRIELTVKDIAMGVSSSSSVLASGSGTVGDTIDLGPLGGDGQRPIEMRVELPYGTFYRVVTRQNVEEGTLELTIYPKGSIEALSVARVMVQIQPIQGRLMVREVQVVENSSSAYAGAGPGEFRVNLPSQATRLNLKAGFAGDQDIKRTDDGFEYRLMFPPGRTILAYYYFIRTQDDVYEMERRITTPTKQFVVNLPRTEGLEVQGQGLERRQGQSGAQGRSTLQFVGRNLSSGQTVRLRFKGMQDMEGLGGMTPGQTSPTPQASPGRERTRPSSVSTISWPLILGIGFSVLVFVGSYAYVRYQLSSGGALAVESSFLVEEIARLDQEYEDGAIREPYYRRTRRRWKQALRRDQERESSED